MTEPTATYTVTANNLTTGEVQQVATTNPDLVPALVQRAEDRGDQTTVIRTSRQ